MTLPPPYLCLENVKKRTPEKKGTYFVMTLRFGRGKWMGTEEIRDLALQTVIVKRPPS